MRADSVAVRLLWLVLGISTLDLTTSLIPSPADHLWPLPPKSTWLLWIQVLLALPFVWMTGRWLKALWPHVNASAMPRAAMICLGVFVAVAALHVSLRYESFPFSPVAMFSCGVTPRVDHSVRTEGYVVVSRDGEVTPFGSLLEGNPLFGRYDLDWDYKAGWAMYIYGYVQSVARDELVNSLAKRGYPRVIRTRFVYDQRTGEILWPKLKRKTP